MKNNNKRENDSNRNKKIRSLLAMLVVCLGITVLFTTVMNRYRNGEQVKKTYSEFLQMLDKKQISKVEIKDNKIVFEGKDGKAASVKKVSVKTTKAKGASKTKSSVSTKKPRKK